MNLTTNIKLFTSGYSLDDIKEISSIEGMTDDLAIDIAKKGLKIDDINDLINLSNELSKATDAKSDDESEDNTDYKALYEAEKVKVEKLQKLNIKKTVGDKPESKTDFSVLQELMKNSTID